MKVQRVGDIIRIDAPLIRGERWLLFRSDAHSDSPYSNGDMELRHLKEARQRKAIILDGGDLFDAMQGLHDRRREKGGDPEHDVPDYYDAIVQAAVTKHLPFSKQFAVLAQGNHESAVLRHNNTDLTGRLAAALGCVRGAYQNWISLRLGKHQRMLYHHHGSGGAAPVTKGVIRTARRAAYLPGADFVLTGHTHQGWLVPIAREVVSDNRRGIHVQWHVQCPGYKDEYRARQDGWAVEKEFPPAPIGAWWIRFYETGGELREEITFAG